MSEQEKSKESIRRLAREWPPEDTSFFHVMITEIERSLPPESKHQSSKKALEYCKKAREFGFTEKGLIFLVEAEAFRKDFLLYDLAVKGELFTKKPPRGTDELGHVLSDILKRIGKNAPSKTVLKELRKMTGASSPNAIIQEVDGKGVIFWLSNKGVDKQTTLRSFENRLTSLRKNI
ncbi:MAG: hypothetical protein Q8K59_09265 [Nitrosomonas sp.]|nr:hypothetical protein [Nitrosomonas sp.]MDP1951264.1 hypothetical protein [Nitrosomonas sp.]